MSSKRKTRTNHTFVDLQFIHSNLISCLQICKYNAYQQRWEWSHLQLDWVMNWWWKQADGNKRRRVGKMWSHWALPVYKQPPSHEKMWNILCTTLKNAYRSYLTWMTWVPPEEPSFSYGMIDDTYEWIFL